MFGHFTTLCMEGLIDDCFQLLTIVTKNFILEFGRGPRNPRRKKTNEMKLTIVREYFKEMENDSTNFVFYKFK